MLVCREALFDTSLSAFTGMATQALKNGSRPDLSKVSEHVFTIEDCWTGLKKKLWVPLPVHWVQAARGSEFSEYLS